MNIPPVFVLSTGRCGSTMLSQVLNRHPDILSVSELFASIGMRRSFPRRPPSGDRMWTVYSRQTRTARMMLKGETDEVLYPVDDPAARFSRRDVPPILLVTLPHLTDRHEALYDELEPFVRGQPRQAASEHFRRLFEYLGERFGGKVWVERSGASLIWASRLLPHFPDARVIHLYRDGRDVALSMHRHFMIRKIIGQIRWLRSWGGDVEGAIADGKRLPLSNKLRLGLGIATMPLDRSSPDAMTLAECGRFWNTLIETSRRVFDRLPADRLLNVKYEDVQAEPETQFRRIVRFIDPSLEDDAWVHEVSALLRPTPPRYERLEAAERAALTEACRPSLERLGYPL